MSTNLGKYANLPDIDTAPDLYETPDVFPSPQDNKEDSEDEGGAPPRQHNKKNAESSTREELDTSSLMDPEEASKKFRKAEKRHYRPRIQYTYPPSPDSSGRTSPVQQASSQPLSQRLKRLQAELAQLEQDLSDPSNPLLNQEKEDSLGDLLRGVVDVKGRLELIQKVKEGRGKLVSAMLEDRPLVGSLESSAKVKDTEAKAGQEKHEGESEPKAKGEVGIAEMDRRVGELEKIIGSSSAPLDELSPLPPPLLPLLTRLNSQLTLLTQPRHIDSISRRLKLLLSDLDRVSSSNAQHHSSAQRRQHSSQPQPSSSQSPTSSGPSPLQEQLTPILTRLAPLLPHIPHILARLRTLSALHTSAAGFQGTLEGLEEEQKKNRSALQDLLQAVEGVENSLTQNESVVKANVQELEERVEEVNRKIEELSEDRHSEEEVH